MLEFKFLFTEPKERARANTDSVLLHSFRYCSCQTWWKNTEQKNFVSICFFFRLCVYIVIFRFHIYVFSHFVYGHRTLFIEFCPPFIASVSAKLQFQPFDCYNFDFNFGFDFGLNFRFHGALYSAASIRFEFSFNTSNRK